MLTLPYFIDDFNILFFLVWFEVHTTIEQKVQSSHKPLSPDIHSLFHCLSILSVYKILNGLNNINFYKADFLNDLTEHMAIKNSNIRMPMYYI